MRGIGLPPGRREAPLVPTASVAGRALVSVVAIMTFLAALAAGTAALVADASRTWQISIARDATVQVMPAEGRDVEADVARVAAVAAATPGVVSVEPYGRDRVVKLLEPWLGAALDLGELPVPRLVAIRLDAAPGAFDPAALASALRAAVPGTTLDDHGSSRGRLAAAADALEAVAAAVCALMLLSLALAVGFATRGAVAGNREIIGVLHLVGAEDRFIAREFQRRFFSLGAQGAAIGGGTACLAFAIAGVAVRRLAVADAADQVDSLFGGFALGPAGYGAIALVALGTALLTGWTSRSLVVGHLKGLG